ncbi:MAG: hypothetical protein LBJ58_02755 [Tannerellaceae bacterium]|jgi:hypothetical protein|nr:hypothetical protein [Tannerellaceae bacterium]
MLSLSGILFCALSSVPIRLRAVSGIHVGEILLKEEEKHRLKYIGIIDNWADIVSSTENAFVCYEASYTNCKNRLLHLFYNSILDYGKFIRDGKVSNYNLKLHHFRKTGTYVSGLNNMRKDGLDKELKTPAGITFAWHFSNLIYDEIYELFCRSDRIFGTPEETDDFFFGESKNVYPMDINGVVKRLTADDASFWDVCARYIRDLSRKVVGYFLQRSDDHGFSDLIKDQTWTDAYMALRYCLVEKNENLPKFENGNDFRNYLIKVCKYQAGNIQRKYMHKNEYIEDLPSMRSDYNDEEEWETDARFFEEEKPDAVTDSETYELDINTDNPYEVANAVSIILLNSNHPFRPALVNGIEDKVRILIDKATNGMSYNDIISEQYDELNPGEEKFRHAVVKARKDYERVRKTLCNRLKDLVKEKTMTPVTNQTSPI